MIRFISIEPEIQNNQYVDVMTVMYIYEPPIIEYVKSFFGLFKPWPLIREHEVKFIWKDNIWIENSTSTKVSDDLTYLLDSFRNYVRENPFSGVIGLL